MSDLAPYYIALGLDPRASEDEIKEAWRDLAQVWHPDRFSGNDRLQQKAQEKLKQINEAYRILTNPNERLRKRSGAGRRTRSSWVAWQREDESAQPDLDPHAILSQGVNAWNLWRKKHSDVTPGLLGADLRKAELSGADLRDVDLTGAILMEADLYKANLSGALLKRAVLSKADISRATLVEADLTKADLFDADLSSANLEGANFTGAVLNRANLVGANCEGANFAAATGLTREQVALLVSDLETRWPPYL